MKAKNPRNSKFYQHFDATRVDFTPYGFTCELWSPAAMPRSDRHNEIELNFLRSGSLTYLLGGRRVTVEHGRLTVFWAALPHRVLTYQTCRPYHVVTLPLASFLKCQLPGGLIRPILHGEIIADPRPNPDDALAFDRWFEDLRSGSALRRQAAEIEIHARLLRLALTLPERKTRSRRATGPRGLDSGLTRADQIACYIAQRYMEPLTAEKIARAVGLHPNYAMALFRKAFGATMFEFLLQHRLSHAQRLLVTTDEPIIEVSAMAGFQSLSRFNEYFKQVCGCPPRIYRKVHHESLHTMPRSFLSGV